MWESEQYDFRNSRVIKKGTRLWDREKGVSYLQTSDIDDEGKVAAEFQEEKHLHEE